MGSQELSNRDLLESMNGRFNMVFEELRKNDERHVRTSQKLDFVIQQQKEMREERKEDSEILDEIRDTLDAYGKAIDVDAVTVVRHEERIGRLEEKVFN